MAKPNVIINGVIYPTVPEVDIPLSGTSGNAKFYYTGDSTMIASDLLSGIIGYGANGEVSGSIPNNGATGGTINTKAGSVTIPAGFTTGGSVSIDQSAVQDCIAANILANKTILGVQGTLQNVSVSQDSTTKVLSVS